MISASDRYQAMELIEEARRGGARLKPACEQLGLSVRTYLRWTRGGELRTDERPQASRPEPANKLSVEERTRILELCHQPAYASLPPSQIVPRLADQGEYIASESSFYRLLRQADEQHHRGRSKPPRAPGSAPRHRAGGPRQVWSWDISWLAGPVKGAFFYLYLIMDLYSRKIVGWEIFDAESAEHAALLVQRAVLAENCIDQPLILHSDNGSPMKGATLLETLYRLGVVTSYSRPRVSNDNPFSEALFRTCKYRPAYPDQGFETLEAAREWVQQFVRWYNHEHRHSAIQFVTPHERHQGLDPDILAQRKAVYEQAKARHPQRWSGETRNWDPVTEVCLNPAADVIDQPEELLHTE
jgi:transposase InsO family protein